MKTNSAQKRTLAKSYEYLQTLGKKCSHCSKVLVLNWISDAFYRLVKSASILQMFFLCQYWVISVCFEWSISEIFTMKQAWITEYLARYVFTILKQESLISNINEVADMYKVFPGLVSQEEQTLSTVMIMNICSLVEYQCTLCGVISCRNLSN